MLRVPAEPFFVVATEHKRTYNLRSQHALPHIVTHCGAASSLQWRSKVAFQAQTLPHTSTLTSAQESSLVQAGERTCARLSTRAAGDSGVRDACGWRHLAWWLCAATDSSPQHGVKTVTQVTHQPAHVP